MACMPVKRSANNAAHMLPNYGLSVHEEQFWNVDLPVCIWDIVISDQGAFVMKHQLKKE